MVFYGKVNIIMGSKMKMTKELCNKIILSIILFLASACIMDIAVYAQESNV